MYNLSDRKSPENTINFCFSPTARTNCVSHYYLFVFHHSLFVAYLQPNDNKKINPSIYLAKIKLFFIETRQYYEHNCMFVDVWSFNSENTLEVGNMNIYIQ